jgi:DUF3099 family protein
MRSHQGGRRDQAYVVTEARQSRSDEIAQRERRYLVMMGLRVVCFILTVVLFLEHVGWFALIPAVGAITLPYFAVVVANSRKQSVAPGFRAYEPRLPDRFSPPPGDDGPSANGRGS